MKLKPCPFCGSGGVRYCAIEMAVECLSCGAQGPFEAEREDCENHWNVRLEEDGYEIIRPLTATKGTKCGQCGMKFDHGKTYGYHCSQPGCPVFPVVTCRLDQEGKT